MIGEVVYGKEIKAEGQICSYLMSDEPEGTKRIGLPLRKANAHRLMNEMIKLGWVTTREDHNGKSYAITDDGVEAFENLQRSRLSTLVPSEVPNAIALNHLHLMSDEDAMSGLKERREQLRAHIAVLEGVPIDMREVKGGIELLYRQHITELAYVEELMARY